MCALTPPSGRIWFPPPTTVESHAYLAVPASSANGELSLLVQGIAPNIHPWNANVVFSVDRLRRDAGWEPRVRFPEAVERTWAWYRHTGRAESAQFDFAFEDALLELVQGA